MHSMKFTSIIKFMENSNPETDQSDEAKIERIQEIPCLLYDWKNQSRRCHIKEQKTQDKSLGPEAGLEGQHAHVAATVGVNVTIVFTIALRRVIGTVSVFPLLRRRRIVRGRNLTTTVTSAPPIRRVH